MPCLPCCYFCVVSLPLPCFLPLQFDRFCLFEEIEVGLGSRERGLLLLRACGVERGAIVGVGVVWGPVWCHGRGHCRIPEVDGVRGPSHRLALLLPVFVSLLALDHNEDHNCRCNDEEHETDDHPSQSATQPRKENTTIFSAPSLSLVGKIKLKSLGLYWGEDW